MRFVTKTIHAYLDYPVAALLMAMPFLLQLGSSHPLAKWLSVATGIAALVLTIFTDHKLGVFRVLPYSFHLAVDFLVGVVFAIAPVRTGVQRSRCDVLLGQRRRRADSGEPAQARGSATARHRLMASPCRPGFSGPGRLGFTSYIEFERTCQRPIIAGPSRVVSSTSTHSRPAKRL